jgi:rubrerythrin
MSIVESLLKIVDPVEAHRREEERKAVREEPKRDDSGDPPRFVCRVCGLEDTQGNFCPSCLAGTMRPLPRNQRDPSSAEASSKSSNSK